ncbi:MAG: hypothetical protein V3V59_03155 [Thermodesulfovibrionales bacterium]
MDPDPHHRGIITRERAFTKMKLSFKVLAVLSLMVLYGCAGGVKYDILGNYVRQDKCLEASRYVEEKQKEYGPNRQLLYNLDSGMINMECGYYEKSNNSFHAAEDLAEKLWTKSILKEAASFLLNDYTIPYAGEDYERALINLFSAINYAMLSEFDEALVECRRLDANLSVFNEKYDEKNVYKEDAFGRYLSGIIYESVGSIDDAFIDYYKAFETYRDYESYYGTETPSILIEDLIRVALLTGRSGEVDQLLEEFGINKFNKDDLPRNMGKIVFIHLNGRSPVKTDNKIIVPSPRGPITIAFPRLIVTDPACKESEVVVISESGKISVDAELVEDINKIAVKNLDDRKGRLVVKEIARVIAKQGAIDIATGQIEDEGAREMTRFLLNIVNTAIETADTRSWRTLPGEIYMTRIFLPEGWYKVQARACGRRKDIVSSIEIKAGQTKFLLHDTMY